MSDEHRPRRADTQTPDELKGLRRLAVKVFLALSSAVVLVDLVGLFHEPPVQVDPILAGLVFGVLLALLGLEAANRLVGGR